MYFSSLTNSLKTTEVRWFSCLVSLKMKIYICELFFKDLDLDLDLRFN